MTLAELEKIIDVKFPKKFHEIYETGAMEWIEVGNEKFNENREHYLNDPKAFLMLSCDCEPLFFEDIPNAIEELNENLEYRKEYNNDELDGKYRLIPFGMWGNGDYYCFLYEDNVSEPSVVLYFNDCYDNPDIIGRNFDEFLYTVLLSIMYDEEIESEQWKNNIDFLLPEYKNMIAGKNADELNKIYESIIFEEAEIFS